MASFQGRRYMSVQNAADNADNGEHCIELYARNVTLKINSLTTVCGARGNNQQPGVRETHIPLREIRGVRCAHQVGGANKK